MNDLDRADQLAAEVVALYAKLGKVAAVVRQHDAKARIIMPMDQWRTMAYMLYQCADECSAHVGPPSKAKN